MTCKSYFKNIKSLDILIFIFPALILSVMLVIKQYDRLLFTQIIIEDSIIEYATSIAYLFASIISISISPKTYKTHKKTSILYFILALGLFFISMEEISWGQRIFNIDSPQHMLENNYRAELNLHNTVYAAHIIGTIFIIIGVYGSFSRILCCIINKIKPTITTRTINSFCPSYSLFFYFFYTATWGIKITLILWGVHIVDSQLWWQEIEIAELYLGLGFLIFVIMNRINL